MATSVWKVEVDTNAHTDVPVCSAEAHDVNLSAKFHYTYTAQLHESFALAVREKNYRIAFICISLSHHEIYLRLNNIITLIQYDVIILLIC